MSDRTADIRMYVEHLFEGRTLTPETIELKEEIYGNLVARYEDYLAQGMDADEAFRRTCEAVTSVDDVLDGEGTAKAGRAGDGAEQTWAAAEPVAGAPRPPEEPRAETPGSAPKKRWTVGKVVAVVALVIVALGVVGALLFQVLVTPVSSHLATDSSVEVIADDSQVTNGTTHGTVTENSTTGDTGTTVGDSGLLNTAGLINEIRNHDQTALAGYANMAWAPDDATLADVLGGMPLAEWLLTVGSAEQQRTGNTVVVEYEFAVNDHVHDVDDDALERAVAYNAMAVLSLVPDADDVQVKLREIDAKDGELDVDGYHFRRSDMEAVLGTTLTADSLGADAWDSLRGQILSEHVCEHIIDLAEY